MTALGFLLDAAVVLLLVGLATRLLLTRHLFEAIVLFVSYGLTLSLAWVRLGAPNIALAEAALGAGVTGALFLNTYQRLTERIGDGPKSPLLEDDGSRDPPAWFKGVLGGGVLLLVLGAGWALLGAGRRPAFLPHEIAARLPETGVQNPVTGVLLNFRGYDTLLEIAVLVAAMAGVWSLDRGSRRFGRARGEPDEDPVLHALTRFAVPVTVVTAVYLTWVGSTEPGGAFQAGSLLAGAGVLLTVAGVLPPPTAASRPVRAMVAGGMAGFILAGIAVLPLTGQFLHYPEGWAYPMILGIEALLTVSIAVVLVELFVDVPAVPEPDPALESVDPSGDPLGRALRGKEGS